MAVLFATAGVVYLADVATKQWALASLTPGVPRPLIGDLLRLHLTFNPGAAFSLGTGITPVFTVLMAAVSMAVIWKSRSVRHRGWAVALGLLLAGACGNLTDRLTRPPGFGRGHVVDFLELPHWPIFNVADSAIVTAACLIAILTWREVPMSPAADIASEGAPARSVTGVDEGER